MKKWCKELELNFEEFYIIKMLFYETMQKDLKMFPDATYKMI